MRTYSSSNCWVLYYTPLNNLYDAIRLVNHEADPIFVSQSRFIFLLHRRAIAFTKRHHLSAETTLANYVRLGVPKVFFCVVP